MQVTKITSPAEAKAPAAHRLTDKQLYDEINSRKIFVPYLAEIL